MHGQHVRRARPGGRAGRGRRAGRRTASSTASANGAPPSSVGSMPSSEVVHDRVADERDLEDVVARRRRRPCASSAVSFARQPRTARVSSFSAPGFIITYETRLIRSSPKRICGFIAPAEASTSPVREVAEVPGDGRRADVEGDPVGRVVEAGPDRRHVRVVVDGDGDAPARDLVALSHLRAARAGAPRRRGRRTRARSAPTRARAPRAGGRGRSSATARSGSSTST